MQQDTKQIIAEAKKIMDKVKKREDEKEEIGKKLDTEMEEPLRVSLERKQCPKRAKRGNLMENKISDLNRILQSSDFQGVVDLNGKLTVPSSEIFRRISDAMCAEYRMQPKYIYTVLLENRYHVYSNLITFLNIEAPIQEISLNDSTLNTSNYDYEFRLNVTEIWPSMQPEMELHKFKDRDRIVKKLRKNSWTHVVFEGIQTETNLPCALNFKHSRVTENEIFVTIVGSCSECSCEFLGQIIQEPQEGEVIMMECRVKNFDPSVFHSKKRPLQGKLRTAVGNMLLDRNLLPCQHRRNEAHRLIQTVGDESPPHLIKKEIFGKAKQEATNKRLGITNLKVIDSLCELKYDADKYQGAIRNIGIDPPFVHYWTKEQQILFEKFPETLILDGTGSVVTKITLANGEKCSHLYLYQGLIEVNGKSVPVFQMISSSQNTNAIMTWLNEFRRIGLIENPNYPYPKEVISDFDKAILGALARSYARTHSLSNYLEICFDVIRGIESKIPQCIIRLDVCHYTQMIARWNCYPKYQPGVRAIYLRSMCLLRKQEDFADLKKMVISILTLALCKNGNEGSLAYEAKEFLKMKIRGFTDEKTEEVIKNSEMFEQLDEKNLRFDELDEKEDDIGLTTLAEWVRNIYNEVEKLAENEKVSDDDEVNGYRLPQFAEKVRNLLLYFPIFTEIIRKIRESGKINPTSASVESYFNDLKNRTFRAIGLPLRADKFVAIHILDITKKLKEAAAGSLTITKSGEMKAILKKTAGSKRDTKINKTEKIESVKSVKSKNLKKKVEKGNQTRKRKFATEDSDHYDDRDLSSTELNNEHNWRNKNEKIRGMELKNSPTVSIGSDEISDSESLIDVTNLKKARACRKVNTKHQGAQYGEVCPQFEPSSKKSSWLPILPNGLKCKNVRERSIITVVSNSCAIDSILQIVSMLIVNDDHYRTQIKDISSDIFQLARLFVKYNVCAAVYRERARVLRDSNTTVKEMTQYAKNLRGQEKVMLNIVKVNAICNVIGLASELFSTTPSYSINFSCTICEKSTTDDYPVVHSNSNDLLSLGIGHLLESLPIPPKRLRTCCDERLQIKSCFYGPQLLICTEIAIPKKWNLFEIPVCIKISENAQYRIAGLITYEGIYDYTVPGHYVGYVYVGRTWLRYDDVSSSKSPSQINGIYSEVDPHLLYYVKIPA